MIPNGSVVNYIATWPPGNLFGFSDYTAAVLADITAAGLTVRGNASNNDLQQILGTPFKINLQIQINNGVGFDSPDDIIAIIRHWVNVETGSYPSAETIPKVTLPGSSTPVSTGQPEPANASTTAHACGDPSWGFFDDPGQWLECLTTKGLSIVGLLAIGVAVGIAFLLFAEHEA